MGVVGCVIVGFLWLLCIGAVDGFGVVSAVVFGHVAAVAFGHERGLGKRL